MSSSPASHELPTLADIRAAADRLRPVVVPTPLIESRTLNEALGTRILVKAECLQRTGSFKFRGAYNTLARLNERAPGRPVVTYSSGNHGRALAAAARLLGHRATVVMPADAPAIKSEATRAEGARLVLYDRARNDRRVIAERFAEDEDAMLVPPFDHRDVIAGQGTVGLELLAQIARLDTVPDTILVPCSGGGLTAGIATAFRGVGMQSRIRTVEPEGFDDTARSLIRGSREPHGKSEEGFCDALLAPAPGRLTFAILKQCGVEGLTVSDSAVRTAMATAFRELKIVLEPGGAAAMAAAMAGARRTRSSASVVVIASGGNVDAATFAAAITQPEP